jgi:hypothetical protein
MPEMEIVMFEDVLKLFTAYMGNGLITIWFLIAVVYLFVHEKRKDIRVMFVYMPVLLLIIYFNPIFAGVVYNVIGEEIYYRFLWLLPITPVIAYTVADIYSCLKGKKKAVFALAAAVLIMISGSFVYADAYFHKAENIYHMPDSVVDICDAIEIEGREVTAVFPAELLQYVRQYSGTVCMPYGREITVERWINYNPLYYIMESENPDAMELTDEARAQGCIYIVLPDNKEIAGSLAACDFNEFFRTDGYIVYIDSRANL